MQFRSKAVRVIDGCVVDGCAGCPNQGAAVVVQALTAGGNGCELRPFWNVLLMAVRYETKAFISWL
jgi:hypothetical protein